MWRSIRTARGRGRFGREAGAFLVNPVRGFNRIVSGDAWEVKGNPANPYDWRPPYLDVTVRVGARVMGEGESIVENTNYYGFAGVALKLEENEHTIADQLLSAQGEPMDVGGYYLPDDAMAEKAMRPSETFNAIIDAMETSG